MARDYVPRPRFDEARAERASLTEKLSHSRADAAAASIQADALREALAELRASAAAHERQRQLTAQELRRARDEAATAQAELTHLEARLVAQQAEFERLRTQSRDEFANVSSQLLRRSGEALREDHARALRGLLDPVRVKLHEFQEQVDRKFADETRDKAALRAQIEQLTQLNQTLSGEAAALTAALKGDSKAQGDWGELQLEGLLEAAGLSAGVHFDTQATFRSEAGRQQRPDCIVRLPGERCLVVDSKVSLTAFERFCGSDTEADAQRELRAHVASLRAHVRQLGAKAYQKLGALACPDYVLLFVPVEPAFVAAAREAPTLFTEALSVNVVIVSPSTLLATLRTVAYIWRQDDQQTNAAEIAEVGRKLYDKFAGFVDDMNAVGEQLERARGSYDRAMDKLSRSPKRATTLVARAEELRRLGVPTTKRLAG